MSMMVKPKRRMPAGEFKAKCLAVLDQVARTKSVFIVTKHGRPVAQLVPIPPEHERPGLLGSVTFHGDIVAPLDETWEAES